MKRMIGIVTILAVILVAAGCGGSDKNEVTSASVEMVTSTTAAEDPASEEETTEAEPMEETTPEAKPSEEAAKEAAAKTAGPLLFYEVRTEGDTVETIHYLYDEQGRKIGAGITGASGSKAAAEILYTYDDQGKLTEECNTSKNGGYNVYSYDADGRLEKEEHYSVGKDQKPGKLQETLTYSYGKGEQPEKLTVLTADGKEMVIMYEYDGRGDVIASVASGNTISGSKETSVYSRGDKGELFSIVITTDDPAAEWTDTKNEFDYSGRLVKSYNFEHPTAKDLDGFKGAYESKGIDNWSTMTEYFYNTDMP